MSNELKMKPKSKSTRRRVSDVVSTTTTKKTRTSPGVPKPLESNEQRELRMVLYPVRALFDTVLFALAAYWSADLSDIVMSHLFMGHLIVTKDGIQVVHNFLLVEAPFAVAEDKQLTRRCELLMNPSFQTVAPSMQLSYRVVSKEPTSAVPVRNTVFHYRLRSTSVILESPVRSETQFSNRFVQPLDITQYHAFDLPTTYSVSDAARVFLDLVEMQGISPTLAARFPSGFFGIETSGAISQYFDYQLFARRKDPLRLADFLLIDDSERLYTRILIKIMYAVMDFNLFKKQLSPIVVD